jgi:hypothetical protein
MKKDERFWHRWILSYSLGELLGIGAAAIIARFFYMAYSHLDETRSTTLNVFVLIAAGTSEGLIIGYVQWKSLSRVIRSFKLTPWIVTTTVASILGWFLILPPAVLIIFFFARLSTHDQYTSILSALIAGSAFGGLIGITQFFIIRKFFTNALIWILANSISWSLSFLILYFALLSFSGSLVNTLLILLACLFSGLAQGMVTGTSLHFLMGVKSHAHDRKHAHESIAVSPKR